ncbi:hypothetical protein, partial [Nonomuraea glycinis]|uniref:hypothetical protein n=1 Tax=Nonomuraea glycinis TaxID=2047744 RepID=UPI0033B08C56
DRLLHGLALGRRLAHLASLLDQQIRRSLDTPRPGDPDPYAAERELLGLAGVVHIGEIFTPAEHKRAEAAAEAGDVRIALALRSEDYGLTQVIAAAPQLINQWKGADPYAAAVLGAAIDATRLGMTSPLPTALLRQAAPGYCDARQRAKATPNWFETALAYLTEELHGAAAALAPIAAPGAMGSVAGYAVADYLQQHASRERRKFKVPATCWEGLVDHLTDPGEQRRVGEAARDRLLYRYAEPLFHNSAGGGSEDATKLLIDLVFCQGREQELQALAESGDGYAAGRLAHLLAKQSREGDLRVLAESGDTYAAESMADLLAEQGREQELQALTESGDGYAAKRLAMLLAEQGREEQLLALAESGIVFAAVQLILLLNKQHRIEDLQGLLERWQRDGVAGASERDESTAGQMTIYVPLYSWREEDLRPRAETGDPFAATQLADLLFEQGRAEALRAVAENGNRHAALRLADLLAEQGRECDLRALIDHGDQHAAERLIKLIAEQGRVEEAELMRRYGLSLED